MNRRTALIGLTLGGITGAAIGASYVRRNRPTDGAGPAPTWPPLIVDDAPTDDAAHTNGSAAAVGTDPVVPEAETDVVVAPGPDPQPEREGETDEPPEEPPAGPSTSATPDAIAGLTLLLDAIDADDGTCPASHPVKGKLSSRIFHVPGLMNYERTRADRCYIDAAAAEREGLRVAKR